MPVPFIVRPEQAPRPLDVVGEKITVLASSEQTGVAGEMPPGERTNSATARSAIYFADSV